MKEKIISIKEKYLLFLIGFTIILSSASFIISSLRAGALYKKALSKARPVFASEKKHYYLEVIGYISETLALRADNAEYYATKADYLQEASNSGLAKVLNLNSLQIEDLYIDAVKLNPLNFEYHLKLGWFYKEKDKPKAEQELIKATKLYPTYYRPHLYLGKFYLENGNENLAFKALIVASYYAQSSWGWGGKIIEEITPQLKETSQLFLSGYNILTYTMPLKTHYFDFKEQGFPHLLLPQKNVSFAYEFPLKIKVYTKGEPKEVILYKGQVALKHFVLLQTQEYTHYELNLDKFSFPTYLDELKIRTNPPTTIEKLELIKQF